uniref:HAT C-terminal dimerisation domain-containing protein n=1 Tax=Poecilia formosa TaxID=48698 RepID=A0A096MCD0_POEFO
ECGIFNKNWVVLLYLFTEVRGKAVCLVCGEQIAVFKKINLKHIFVAEKARKSEVLLAKLLNAARYQALSILRCSNQDQLCDIPQNTHSSKFAVRTRRTVTRRIEDIAEDIAGDVVELQLQREVPSFDFFSLALDESYDVRDTAQLLIFVRGITPDLKITVELATIQSLKGTTTGSDLFTWLRLGKMLKRVWDLKVQIRECCETKGKDISELSDLDWMEDFAFAVDVTALMNERNTKLQGKAIFVHEMNSLVKAFMRKIQFLSRQLESNNLTHMQTLKEVTPSADHLCRYSAMLGALHDEFSRRFKDLRTMESKMHMISSPFTFSVDDASSDVQLELIVLGENFKTGSLLDSCSSLKEENFPNIRKHAQKMFVLFGSTYICEQTFSVMKLAKRRVKGILLNDSLSPVPSITT